MRFADLLAIAILGTLAVAIAEDVNGPAEFELPVPVGMPATGIKIPQYDADGRLILLFEAAEAQKTDDDSVSMTDLRLEASDDQGRKILVELPSAVFQLSSRLLTGDRSATIRRDDFQISGDSIEFDTRTRHGTLRGEIKMLITSENDPT